MGLIESTGRRGGRRHYDPEVLSRLAFIALCQDVGFTLAEIASLVDDDPRARDRWKDLAERKLTAIERQVERLQTMQRHLEAALACTCERVEGCELVEDAGRRRAHRTSRQRRVPPTGPEVGR